MAVFYNSISAFIESVGRRTTNDKRNTLDRITCIFTGPSSGALAFKPANGTPHPEFPLMYCEKSNILAMAGLVAEVRVDYIGKLDGSPSGIYRSAPAINTSRYIGSISYTRVYPQRVNNSTHDFFSYYTVLVTKSFSDRFSSKSVTFKYLTNHAPSPDSDGYFADAAAGYLGVENHVSFTTACTFSALTIPITFGVWGGQLSQSLVFENDLTNLQVDDMENGWYEVQETFMTQALINSTLV